MEISNIQCLLEFGSYARGDDDYYSDYDICAFVSGSVYDNNSIKDKIFESIKELLLEKRDFNLIIYDENSLDLMLEKGSLFLWHLKYESNILFGEEYFKEKITKLITGEEKGGNK